MTDEPTRLCAIPSKTLGPCDLEWGHKKDIHESAKDAFYSREHADEHRRRQKEAGHLSPKVFCFSISGEAALAVEDIWPDGDAPENPTLDDVLKVITGCGGRLRVLEDWDLLDDLDLDVSDDTGIRHVP